jgi:uncharacterized protein YecE (DUF72 family)
MSENKSKAALKAKGGVYIGTSGWHYDHWKGPFYPDRLPKSEMFSYYSRQFRAVEINNSFYRLPSKETLQGWGGTAPECFVFAVKASRYITHMKKLKDPHEPVAALIENVTVLDAKLGPILFQLPPRWKVNPDRLREFLSTLPEGLRYAFEFRDPSWFDDRIYDALKQAGAALCMYDLAGRRSPKRVTADFIYIRLHGPDAAYEGQYDTSTLTGWAGAMYAWLNQGKEIFCFFDNDQNGYAAQDALRLQKMMK